MAAMPLSIISSKLAQSRSSSVFTDVSLIIDDGLTKHEGSFHKIILYSGCDYFEKILTSAFIESGQSVIRIQPPNADVCYDVIMSFYGVKSNVGGLEPWHHMLETISCYDFLGGIKFDTNCLLDIVVPNEGHALLLKNLELLEMDDNVCIVAYKYFGEILKSKELNALANKLEKYRINLIITEEEVKINGTKYIEITKRITIRNMNGYLMKRLIQIKDWKLVRKTPDNNFLLIASDNHILVWDIWGDRLDKKIEFEKDQDRQHLYKHFFDICMYDNKIIVIFSSWPENNILMYDYTTSQCNVKSFQGIGHPAYGQSISTRIIPEKDMVIFYGSERGGLDRLNRIEIYQISTGDSIKSFYSNKYLNTLSYDTYINFCVDADSAKIIAWDKSTIQIVDITTSSTWNFSSTMLKPKKYPLCNVIISPDNRRIIAVSTNVIETWNFETLDPMSTFGKENNNIYDMQYCLYISNDSKYLSCTEISKNKKKKWKISTYETETGKLINCNKLIDPVYNVTNFL